MTLEAKQFIRVAKHLISATGYLELGMTRHALAQLDNLGELGPFEAATDMLRGEVFRVQGRYDAAAGMLESAAQKFAAPHDRSAWLALSLCYREAGDLDRAIQTLAHARGVRPPKPKRPEE
jgi:tetratricopeptide (TPR) repeat protein